jgi:glycosyltransferase Alg8
MDQQSWTRQKTTLDRSDAAFDQALNRWSSKTMQASALALFGGVVALLLTLSQP